jgi:hypothetical protein
VVVGAVAVGAAAADVLGEATAAEAGATGAEVVDAGAEAVVDEVEPVAAPACEVPAGAA